MSEVTSILSAIDRGDAVAAGQLLPLVYEELRRLAAQKLARENPRQTLQATALVHEAYLRLVGPADDQRWQNRGHFFAAAAEAMRRIVVESARRVAMRPVCLEGSDGFVTSTAAPIATGWSDPVAGWELHPLKTNNLPRRTSVMSFSLPVRTVQATRTKGDRIMRSHDRRKSVLMLERLEGRNYLSSIGVVVMNVVQGMAFTPPAVTSELNPQPLPLGGGPSLLC